MMKRFRLSQSQNEGRDQGKYGQWPNWVIGPGHEQRALNGHFASRVFQPWGQSDRELALTLTSGCTKYFVPILAL
jgi:hypothetical protein